jgi:hypothetical protein
MKQFKILMIMALFFGLGKIFGQNKQNAEQSETEERGIIGEYSENDKPVIMKFVNELPEKKIMDKFPFLVVVSWKYNGEKNNGMPEKKINERMILLEDAIEKSMESSKIFTHAYSRTGNNIKEFVYYGTNQEDFMNLLNQTLANHKEYPIEINFYEDKDWTEFKKVLEDFKEK